MKTLDLLSLPWEGPVGFGEYLEESELCDLSSKSVVQMTESILGGVTNPNDAARVIYHFVKDNLVFMLPPSILTKASQVLATGGGDSVSKSVCLVSMMRLARIPARFKVSIADSSYLKGLYVGIVERFVPKTMVHLMPEIHLKGRWITLEGVVLDRMYLEKLSTILNDDRPCFSLGVADKRPLLVLSKDIENWDGESDTFCQSTCVLEDLGVHTNVEEIFAEHIPKKVQSFIFSTVVSPSITKNVSRLRMI